MFELALAAGVIGLLAVIVWARSAIQARQFNHRS